MTILCSWFFVAVLHFLLECSVEVQSSPVSGSPGTDRSGGVIPLIWVSLASVLSLVVVVVVCLCCYSRPSTDDSDSDDQSKCSDDQADAATSRDERKQLTLQTQQSAKKGINFPWPISERSITVKGIQPDQFGLSSLNRSLGVTSPQSNVGPSTQLNTGPGYAENYGGQHPSGSEGAYDAMGYCDTTSPHFYPQLGRIQFRLGYDFQQMTLTLKLICGVDLPAKDFSGTSDPYVKIYLLPDRKHKVMSNIKRKSLNPQWNEIFTFEGFPYSKLVNKSLYLQVLDYDRFSRDDPIGEVIIPLNDINLINGETLWRELQPCKGHIGRLGELLLSLCYHPTQGTINVVIIRAKQLKAKDINGLSDPYVKIWLLRDGKKVEKRKTKVHQKTLDPELNENFVFNVPYEHVRHTSLLISVMDHDFIGVNELIGQILLGCKSSPLESKHWNEMLTKPRQTIEKWHMLKDLG